MSELTFLLTAIDPTAADRLRAAGGPVVVADESPGYPCRQCLTDALVGEELVLVSHDPFDATSTSPYRGASPIFLHREPCAPHVASAVIPDQQARRTLSVRGFDREDVMLDAAIVEGTGLRDAIEQLFANPEIDHLHVHNATRGCWAANVHRVI